MVALASATASGAMFYPRRPANTGSPKRPCDLDEATTSLSTSLNMISNLGEHFGYPYCHQGVPAGPKFAMVHNFGIHRRPCLISARMVLPLG